MSPWEEYKKRLGTTRPWHLLDKDVPRVEVGVASARLEVCLGCPEFIKVTKQCKQCGCVMPGKVKLLEAKCPLNKW